jgi:hypothetical protein
MTEGSQEAFHAALDAYARALPGAGLPLLPLAEG